jgi:hypothetical protein
MSLPSEFVSVSSTRVSRLLTRDNPTISVDASNETNEDSSSKAEQLAAASQGKSESESKAGETFMNRTTSAFTLPTYYSKIEQELFDCRMPLSLSSTGVISVGSYSGLHLNKHEEASFKGPRSLSSYEVYDDPNPLIVRKPSVPLNFTQQV